MFFEHLLSVKHSGHQEQIRVSHFRETESKHINTVTHESDKVGCNGSVRVEVRSYFNAGDQGRAPEDVTSELREMMDRKGPCDALWRP